MPAARNQGLALAIALAATPASGPLACAVHGGEGWTRTPAEVSPPKKTLRIFAFGDAGSGPASARVAAQLDRELLAADARGDIPVLLWLGDNLGGLGLARDPGRGCVTVEAAWRDRGRARFGEVAGRHRDRGHPSFAALGPGEWRCGQPELAFQEGPGSGSGSGSGPHPWIMPTHNYVVRIARSGSVGVVSSCRAGACSIEPAGGDALVELVFLDTSPWNAPAAQGTAARSAGEASLAQQEALLAALARRLGPPRIAITHHPIETAGPHGLGGRFADSAFRFTAPALQEALDRGLFVGVISAADRNLQVTADIADGVKRSSRHWLAHPVFQVVSGAASRPDGRPFAGPRRWRWYRGQALIPDLMSTHAGFAELRVGPGEDGPELHALLHARRRGRWRRGGVTIPLRRGPLAAVSPSPVLEPCLGCDSGPAYRH